MFHNLAERVRNGETLVGTWLYLNDVGVAEVIAGAGFDFVIIDMEHSPTGFADLRSLIMALENRTAPVVRVKQNSPEYISGVLDQGAAAVMVPRMTSVAEARQAVQAAKYHPLGIRGIGPYRVSDYGRDMDAVFEQANEKQMLWVQIENKEAAGDIEQIVQVSGIDLLFVGFGDLSQSLGHLNDGHHPEVDAVAEKVCRTIRNAGVPMGSAFGGGTADLKHWHDQGMRVFTVDADFAFLINGAATALSQARENLPSL